MPTYYLLARPETVVSIVKKGKLPDKLPDWLEIDHLQCKKKFTACFEGNNTTPLHQLFILELEIPDQEAKQENGLTYNAIKSAWIKQIFVYSVPGNKLLKNLFAGNCPLPIVIKPEFYPKVPGNNKRPRTESKEIAGPPKKKMRIDTSADKEPSQAKGKDSKDEKLPDVDLTRLTTHDEHLQFLKSVVSNTKKTLLITSFGINHDTLLRADLYKLIPLAVARGVKIYIYYNDQKHLDKRVEQFFKKHNILCAETYTHSKIVAADKSIIAAGSFNWLSGVDSHYEESEEGSFVCEGEVCESLVEEFWQHIKNYRNLQFANYRLVDSFEHDEDNLSTSIYDLKGKSELAYIPTLDQHCGFFQDCFETARQRLIICSPFISSAKGYEDDIDHELLGKTVARGVDVYFVCSSKSSSIDSFRSFLDQLNSPKLHLIVLPNIHLKTIIVDENTIAEGSFNWLSATRDDSSDYHNHEQTLFVKGSMAQPLIEKFFHSRVGMAILEDMYKQTDKLKKASSSSVKDSRAWGAASIAGSKKNKDFSALGNHTWFSFGSSKNKKPKEETKRLTSELKYYSFGKKGS